MKFTLLKDMPVTITCPHCQFIFPNSSITAGRDGVWTALLPHHGPSGPSRWQEKCPGSLEEVEIVPVVIEKMQERLI